MINFDSPRALFFMKKFNEAVEINFLGNLSAITFHFFNDHSVGVEKVKIKKAEIHFRLYHTVEEADFIKFFNELENNKLKWAIEKYEDNYTTYIIDISDVFAD